MNETRIEHVNHTMEQIAAMEGHDVKWMGVPIRGLSKDALVGVAIKLAAKLRESYEGPAAKQRVKRSLCRP